MSSLTLLAGHSQLLLLAALVYLQLSSGFKKSEEAGVESAYKAACEEMTRQSLLIRQLYTQNHHMAADLYYAQNGRHCKKRRVFSADDIVGLGLKGNSEDSILLKHALSRGSSGSTTSGHNSS